MIDGVGDFFVILLPFFAAMNAAAAADAQHADNVRHRDNMMQ